MDHFIEASDMALPGREAVRLIATYTDFGPTGPYLGQMSAVLAAAAPKIPSIALMTDAPMFDPLSAGILLSGLCRDLPAGTLILAVVDPGVGGDRRPIMLKNERHLFVGPDNGLFVPLVRESSRCMVETIEWRPQRLSESFHGRDLFAPVAAKLANGERVEGRQLDKHELVGFDSDPEPNRVIYIDHYGNAITGISAETVETHCTLSVSNKTLRYARTFSEVPVGETFWYANSLGLVEFAVNRGSAAHALNIEPGMPVEKLAPSAK